MQHSRKADQPAWLVAGFLGLVWGLVCFALVTIFHTGAADFQHALVEARDLLARRNPYAHEPGPYWIPYPLPAAFLAMPVAWLPDSVVAGLFIGISTGLLAWGILRSGEKWRLGILAAWPFVYAVIWAQWSPLLCAIWFLPMLAPLVLAKPNIALPLVLAGKALTSRYRSRVLAICAAAAAASLALRPSWPIEWLRQTSQYQGLTPPLLILPAGPLILLGLLAWRDRRAWLILSMAIMPQRVFYDQLPLVLVAQNKRQQFFLVCASWISFVALWLSPNMAEMPGGCQLWAVLGHYLPAVGVLLWPQWEAWRNSRRIASTNTTLPAASELPRA